MTRSRTRGKGPINTLPPELLLETFDHLFGSCATVFERQAQAQRVQRVNRAFRSGYLASSAAREWAVGSVGQAGRLARLLHSATIPPPSYQRLDVKLPQHPYLKRLRQGELKDNTLAQVVRGCGGHLRRFVVEEGEHMLELADIEDGLLQEWRQCGEMEEFEFGRMARFIESSQARG